MLLALGPGGFADSPRADALAFLALRPWLLVAGALLVAGLGWRLRLAAYGLGLAAAGAAEAALLAALGNPDPWPETLRGLAGGALLLAPLDLLLGLARRRGRAAAAVAALAAALLLALPPVAAGWRRAMAGPEGPAAPAAPRPAVALMTALPIVWGEGGFFDPASRPALAYRALQEEFEMRPIDVLDAPSLAGSRLLLLAQPRWLAPAELVALDAWVRGGGRALILTDPSLAWESALPLGDIRRPPPAGLLKPLLDHWGLALEPGEGGARRLSVGGRLLALEAPGRFRRAGAACAVAHPQVAHCRIGRGRALLIADADLMRDALWTAPGPGGDRRDRRRADNPLVLADLLDRLAGLDRPRRRDPVAWRTLD